MLLFLAIAGLWGIFSYVLKRGMTGSYWGILAIGELLILAQAVAGVALWIDGTRPTQTVHLLYGAVATISLPGYYAYSKGREDGKTVFNYGLICLFLAGITIRGMTTGS
jgi:hypothetical protein